MIFTLYTILVLLAVFVHPIFAVLAIIILIYRSSYISSTPYVLKNDPKYVEFMYTKARYLRSEAWKRKRSQVLIRDAYTCKCCKTHAKLNVHHISYKNLGNEPLHDLVTLCTHCHTALHEHYGYPKTYSDYINTQYTIPKDLYARITSTFA